MKTNKYLYLALGCSLFTLFASGCAGGGSEQPEVSVQLLWNDAKQPIDGFGIAQAGWADELYSHKDREKVMDEMFGTDGLRLNILRGEIFPHYWENKNDKDFNLSDKLDIDLDDPFFEGKSDDRLRRGQLWLTLLAKNKYKVDKLFFSAWSAPAYMKTNGKVSQGELKPECYQEYADYLADFYKAYTSVGLEPYALSPSNEPGYAAPWNSSLWTPEKMGEFITRYLGPTFKRQQIPARIIFGENPFWSSVSQQGNFVSSLHFTNTILEKYPEITEFNLIASGHGYTLPDNYPAPKDSLLTPIVPFELAEKNNLPVWVTEISDTNPLDTTMADGLKWANTFHAYLTDANVNAFVWWAGAMPTGNNESLIVLNKDRKGYSLTKRYETFGNYTRYITPGSQRIETLLSQPADSLLFSAYKHEGSYTVVAINNSSRPVITGIKPADVQASGSLNSYLTDENSRWLPQSYSPNKNGQYIVTIPPKSVITFTGGIK